MGYFTVFRRRESSSIPERFYNAAWKYKTIYEVTLQHLLTILSHPDPVVCVCTCVLLDMIISELRGI